MISIGNDIVALGAVDKQRTNNHRFQSKFITTTEMGLYRHPLVQSIPFESFVWLLWSVKESVYKYQKRLSPQLLFSPIKIVVQQITVSPFNSDKITCFNNWDVDVTCESYCCGSVVFNYQTLSYLSVISAGMVATLVTCQPSFKHIYGGIKTIDVSTTQYQSKMVREYMLNKMSLLFPKKSTRLENSPVGYPVLFLNDEESLIPISLSHHREFIFYNFKL